jgi:hypothetical protein
MLLFGTDAADIERAIPAIASIPNSGMVVLPESTTTVNRDLIITLAARNRRDIRATSATCPQADLRPVVCPYRIIYFNGDP